jgi:hypothetical protein
MTYIADMFRRRRQQPQSPDRWVSLTILGPAPDLIDARLRPDLFDAEIRAVRDGDSSHFQFRVPGTIGGGADLIIRAEGWVAYRARLRQGDVDVALPDGDAELDAVTLAPLVTRRFPAEREGLEIQDGHFYAADDRIWDWRGATMFMLFARFRRGEVITPQIRWMQRVGVNVARVFVAGVDWRPEWYGDFDDFKRPWDDPAYEEQLAAFFDLLAAEGLRVEATVCTYAIDSATWRRVLQRVYDVARDRWNLMCEGVNEPWVGHGDPVTIYAGVNRYGVLSAYGIQPEGNAHDSYEPCPVLDYCTPHLPRDQKFAHNPKDMLNMRQVLRVPIVDDEPLGIADFSRPAPGARTNDLEAVRSHFATSRLFGGATIHFEAGLAGLAPPEDSITHAIAMAIGDVWAAIPPMAMYGTYAAPHLHNFPIEWENNRDSLVNHAYATIVGHKAWAVNCLPRAGWQAIAKPGWRVVWDNGLICELERI